MVTTSEESISLKTPPPLRYPISQKTKSIAITWSTIIFINTILPIILFYILRHVTHSSTDFVLNICQIPMTATLFQFPYRLWQLKRTPRSRGMLTWDFFQWQFLFGALLITAIYVLAGIMQSYALFAAAPPILFAEVCFQLFVFDILATWELRQPCRMSSVPKGAPFRPGVYYIIEDLTAVDGAGGTVYRENLAERWDVSPPFQRLVKNVGRILASSGILMVGIEVALILVTPVDVFFSVSWLILWTWAALSACFCISYTKACLREEKASWSLVSLGSSTEGLLSEPQLMDK